MYQLPQVALVGPAGAAPELAAIRFIALLPGGWEARLTGCDADTARLRVSAPAATAPTEAMTVLGGVLSDPALQDWQLTTS